MTAARSAPRSEPAKSHDFLPQATPRAEAGLKILEFDESGQYVVLGKPT
jgi:hypothetical protein